MSDDPLRRQFEKLREAEADGAPAFADTLRRARAGADGGSGSRAPLSRAPMSRTPYWALAGGVSAAFALAVALLLPQRGVSPAFDPGRWAVPSDALLVELPGSSVLRDLPDFDATVRPRYTQ